MYFVDTNVFLRFLTEDNLEQAQQSKDFLDEAIDDPNITLVTSDHVITELVFTLRSFYEISRETTEEQITTILGFCKVIRPASDLDWNQVFGIEKNFNVDFIDAVNYQIMKYRKVETIVSFDSDFDKFDDIKRQIPGRV